MVQVIMCGDNDKFVELVDKISDYIIFGDSSKISIKRKCEILFRLKNGEHIIILDVYYEPKLKSNIQSLRQLLEKEFFMKACNLLLVDSSGSLIDKVLMSHNSIFTLNL